MGLSMMGDGIWVSVGGNCHLTYSWELGADKHERASMCIHTCTLQGKHLPVPSVSMRMYTRALQGKHVPVPSVSMHMHTRALLGKHLPVPSVRPRSDTKGFSLSHYPVWHRADNSVNLNTTTRLIKIHTHFQQITFYTIIKSLHNRNFSFKWV